MEAAGLAIRVAGLAGLVSTARDITDTRDTYKSYGLESRPRLAQRDALAALVQQWCISVGYDEGGLKENHHQNLNDPTVLKAVQDITQYISTINGDGKTIPPSTSATSEAAASWPQHSRTHPNERRQLEQPQGLALRKDKLKWALKDKKNVSEQNQFMESLLNTLLKLVPPSQPGDQDHAQSALDAHAPNTLFLAVQELKTAIENLQEWDKKQKHDEFKRSLSSWLGTTRTPATFDNYVQRRLDGICDWIFQRPEFRNWESSTGSAQPTVLWTHGPAGYGKTILCARVIEHLASSMNSPLAYCFFSSGLEGRADPFIVIRSWVFQIVEQNQQAYELARERWEAAPDHCLSQNEIKGLFQAIAQNIRGCTFVVDGLDECAGTVSDRRTDYRQPLVDLFGFLKEATSTTEARLLIVSRKEQEIRDGLYAAGTPWSVTEYQIRPDDVKLDAMLYSQSIVTEQLPNKTPAQREQLAHQMVERFDSMFLCIKLVEGHLKGGKSLVKLQKAIDQAPTRLTDLYDQTWKRIFDPSNADQKRAIAILRWATFSLRPMTILEITEALLLMDDDSDDLLTEEIPDTIDEIYIKHQILDLCGSLIETRDTDISCVIN
ncbi:Uu.00g144330.m01.CDS01 [Anthostomella pinea]|uniref:Uu.00g144330.m01.CDS01 n=1 Tax=Anthostomella pinea TaxID=933095 RepID=A0AAI8YLQ6_9PEZI|nr:Uu.00g144330.m01.CDS01 [Anthostomella pinea]